MINKYKNIFLTPKFTKFVIVGIINTINHNIIYLTLLNFLNYMAANLIAFIISMIISFFLNCYFTFNIKPTFEKFMVFPLTNLPNLFFQTVGIYIVVEVIKISKEYGALITAIFSIPLTFLMMKLVLEKIDFSKIKR